MLEGSSNSGAGATLGLACGLGVFVLNMIVFLFFLGARCFLVWRRSRSLGGGLEGGREFVDCSHATCRLTAMFSTEGGDGATRR